MRYIGAIGDPLAIRVVATFDSPADEPVDFTGHTWLAQLRRRTDLPVIGVFSIEDNTTFVPGEPTGLCTVDLTLTLTDTSMLEEAVRYVYGVKAVEGDLSPYTLIARDPIYAYEVVPQAP